MGASYQMIRVDVETYERLRRLRDGRECSFNKLLRELLDGLEAANMNEAGETASKVGERLIPRRCPRCGHENDGSIVESHVFLGSIGIEVIYDACPKCLWPLREILSWKPVALSYQ